jgi:hypothetical protein
LFNALPCCNSCAESGKGTFERAVCTRRRCLYRIKNILILCSGRIFGLGKKLVAIGAFRVVERVGVDVRITPPAPADAPEAPRPVASVWASPRRQWEE